MRQASSAACWQQVVLPPVFAMQVAFLRMMKTLSLKCVMSCCRPWRIFRPGIPEIYRFFSRAKSVSQQAWSHELTWVSCYVSGTVVFKDGRKGSWHVRASAIGTIDIEGPAPVTFHLYCPDCRFHPFWLGE